MLNKILSLGGALLIAIVLWVPVANAQTPKKAQEQTIRVPENAIRPWLTKKEAQKRIDALVEWLNADFPANIGENQAFIARKLTEAEKRELQRQKEAKKAAQKKSAKQKGKGDSADGAKKADAEKAAGDGEEDDDTEFTRKGRYVTLSTVGFLREYSPFARLFANEAAIDDFEEAMEVKSTHYREMVMRLKKLEDKIIVLNGIRSTGNVAEFQKALEKLKAEMRDIAKLASLSHEKIDGKAMAALRKKNEARRSKAYLAKKKKEMEKETAEKGEKKKGGKK